jgi:hypothetical protein
MGETPKPSSNGHPLEAPDASLGGYFREHERPPSFEGRDGQPYTVSVEAERSPDLRAPWEGYLVFPRWATSGLGVIGHLESPTLVRGRSREEVIEALGQLLLVQVKQLLDQAVQERASDLLERGSPEEDAQSLLD